MNVIATDVHRAEDNGLSPAAVAPAGMSKLFLGLSGGAVAIHRAFRYETAQRLPRRWQRAWGFQSCANIRITLFITE